MKDTILLLEPNVRSGINVKKAVKIVSYFANTKVDRKLRQMEKKFKGEWKFCTLRALELFKTLHQMSPEAVERVLGLDIDFWKGALNLLPHPTETDIESIQSFQGLWPTIYGDDREMIKKRIHNAGQFPSLVGDNNRSSREKFEHYVLNQDGRIPSLMLIITECEMLLSLVGKESSKVELEEAFNAAHVKAKAFKDITLPPNDYELRNHRILDKNNPIWEAIGYRMEDLTNFKQFEDGNLGEHSALALLADFLNLFFSKPDIIRSRSLGNDGSVFTPKRAYSPSTSSRVLSERPIEQQVRHRPVITKYDGELEPSLVAKVTDDGNQSLSEYSVEYKDNEGSPGPNTLSIATTLRGGVVTPEIVQPPQSVQVSKTANAPPQFKVLQFPKANMKLLKQM